MAKMKKVHVGRGISWVEVPEAGLFVLCGCPADAVKHLMRRGLIVETERDGVSFETGPNAILLSDVMLQNGAFCNLAEFPVLQMLYRQGMMLPDHPNNKGDKPMLIGQRDQVQAQLHYIYRGNYGLVNREELLLAGASPDLAEDLLAMKQHFAFGHIRHPRELIEAVPLGARAVELKNGVFLRRLGLNQFEFRYEDETVAVDLNLQPGETYDPPYLLGAHRVDREYFAVIHSGEGDGWDANRPSMGSVLMFQGRIYLIDAGPNVQHSLTALGIGINEIEGLFHTHCHDDHFAGLTTLLRTDRRLKYFATPLVRASVTKKLSALLTVDEETFLDCFDVHDLEFDRWNDVGGLEVMPLLSPHPVETSIFRFRALWEDGYRSYAHFADIVSLDLLAGMVRQDGGPGISQAFYDKVAADYALPADLKKLDIGGGLIHGRADDFRGDGSGKIILSHVARPLTVQEREIGSGAPFGTMDVIIPGNHDYVWRRAFESLRCYFPDTPHHELRILLNSPMVVCNPETILLREGGDVPYVYLVITGTVEMIEAGTLVSGLLSSGGMIGQVEGIERRAAGTTYRASSFVQALRISSDLYREFVRRNELTHEVMAQEERRNFLRSTWVCSEALTEMTLNRLAGEITQLHFDAGETVDVRNCLSFVKNGTAELAIGGDVMELLGPGDVFGEEVSVFDSPALFSVRAGSDLEILMLPAATVRDVPVMRWKLLESYERRMHNAVLEAGGSAIADVRWRDDYAVNVQRIDTHHKNLLVRASALSSAIITGRDRNEVMEHFASLIDYTRYHFAEEERLMERYHYSDAVRHRASHQRLLEQIISLCDNFDSLSEQEVAVVLKDWVVLHIQSDDRRLAAELNAKGVY
ncbi:bacteriohemerythrin [mine drainage metagenome]|uniref:Bacteriohemerythrin n=1 Tax=mine drainage metagenome TaxID=410659 RepID=A0A1J5R0G6_9ZZZZ